MTLIVLTGVSLMSFTYLKLTVLKNTFKEYLLSIGDEKTARRIGGLFVHLIVEIETIMEDRYEQTKNKGYLSYYEQYRKLVTQLRMYGILLAVLMILYVRFSFKTINGWRRTKRECAGAWL
jgi:hypothetical protein